jgi:hypothetical protein
LNPELQDRTPIRLLKEEDIDEVGPELLNAYACILGWRVDGTRFYTINEVGYMIRVRRMAFVTRIPIFTQTDKNASLLF